MNENWIQQFTRPPSLVRTPDSPDRGELFIGVVHPFWDTLKADLRQAVAAFGREPGIGRIEVRDEGARLRLNGAGHGADVRLEVEHERVRALYARYPPRGTKTDVVTLTLDIRGDALVALDCRGCIVDAPDRARVLLEPFFRRLATLPQPRRRPPLW